METTGSVEQVATQFAATFHSDPPSAAIREASRFLIADPSFKKRFVAKLNTAFSEVAQTGDLVEVIFKPIPRRASVEIDGNYVGETPLKRQLVLGAKHSIRLKQPRGSVWDGTIVIERNMVIAPEMGADTEKGKN